ncbi:maltokinase N-terminal cap-like domain-containing protein [Microbacterium sp. 22242]|uniref:maltokinase N-terminal cap-like domain-containing protein n=1 Tax=Microbacterium sp. 22242 TaxID=3453896 RepID=UPI003F854BB8
MDSTLACLAAWMPRQRWYSAKGNVPRLRAVHSWELPAVGAQVRIHLVTDDASAPPITYQVPTVARATETVDLSAPAVIGSPEPGVTLVDGAHDAVFTRALLALLSSGGASLGEGARAWGRPSASRPPIGSDYAAEVLSGEQSNTSVVFRPEGDGAPIIAKIFRRVDAGLNPDIELATALAEAGSPFVARAVGSVEGEWPAPAADRIASGSLVFAQEFLPDVEDAWRVALAAAAADEDFTDRARALGAATAGVHTTLAEAFPTRAVDESARSTMIRRWGERLAVAVSEVPELADQVPAIRAVYERASGSDWPDLQRVHGDYHLGQVILVPGRGWVLLDFEGEPLRPMTERREPDLPTRDIAGMLRSFDYVAGSLRLADPDLSPARTDAWSRAARAAFLAGYDESAKTATAGPLLDALELDKAVYETVYEARNRPRWLPIPLGAVARLAGVTSLG